jgi:hypothetical protein
LKYEISTFEGISNVKLDEKPRCFKSALFYFCKFKY